MRGGLVTDAVIVALCREYGVDTVLSNDCDFGRFRTSESRRWAPEKPVKRHAPDSVSQLWLTEMRRAVEVRRGRIVAQCHVA